jgi:demethylmenaquinone methyltransferase/2-methoxy-6-polyprenyl-1,4-benzoquinol methylase
MFHEIAPTYDRLNHLLSLNIDKRWRAITAKLVIGASTHRVLDVCAGTGDLALAFAERAELAGCEPSIVAADFTPAMIRIGAQKFSSAKHSILPLVGDTLHLPFPDATFDVVSVAFGIRNVSNYEAGLREMVRVCRTRGTIAVLEFSRPAVPVLRQFYSFYFFRVLPWVGRTISGTRAYTYLPNSVAAFPEKEQFADTLRAIAGGEVVRRSLSFGIATLYLASKA